MSEDLEDIQWYIARDSQQHGPLSETEMRLFVDGGHLLSTDLLWRPGFEDWRAASLIFPVTEASDAANTASGSTNAAATATDASAPTSGMTAGEAGADTSAAFSGAELSAATSGARGETEQATASRDVSLNDATNATAETSAAPQAEAASSAAAVSQSNETKNDNSAAGANTAASPAFDVSRLSDTRALTQASTQPAEPDTSDIPSSSSGPDAVANVDAKATDFAMAAATPSSAFPDGPLRAQRDPIENAPPPRNDPEPNVGKRMAIAAGLLALIGGGTFYVSANPHHVTQLAESATSATAALLSNKQPEPAEDQSVAVVRADPATTPEKSGAQSAETEVAIAAPPAPQPVPSPSSRILIQPGFSTSEPGSNVVVPTALPPSPAPEPEVDAHYRTSPLWSTVRREFPEWYGARMVEIAKLEADKPKPEVTKYAMQALVSLRRKHAKDALAAPSPRLVEIAKAFVANIRTLKEESTDACYSFISTGETSPSVLAVYAQEDKARAIEAQSTAIFQAIAEGRANPTSRERPQKPDFDQLATELGQLGWTQSDLQLFANPEALSRAAPERVCEMVQDWFDAHFTIKDAATQERLLYETLRPVVAG